MNQSSFTKNLAKWLTLDNQRVVLQRFYLLIAAISFVIANFISLFSNELGRRFLILSALSVGMFVLNATVWALGLALKASFLPEVQAKNSKTTTSKGKK